MGLAGAKERLRLIQRLAGERGAFVNVDMEHYDAKDLTLSLFGGSWRSEDEFVNLPAGIVAEGAAVTAATTGWTEIAWSVLLYADHRANVKGVLRGYRACWSRPAGPGVRGQGAD